MFGDPAIAAVVTGPVLAVLWLGAFIGGLAAGGVGFAFGLVASSIWLHAIDPIYVTFLIVACGTLLHIGLIWPARHGIEIARLWPFIAGGSVGIPLGVLLLARGNAGTVKLALGFFLLVYGVYALLAPRLPPVRGGGRFADGLVGFAGGILSGIGGYSGVLPAIWAQLRGWPKHIARGVFQPYILFAHIATLILVGFLAFNRVGAILLIATLPALFAGAWLGWKVYGKLDETLFQKLLAALLVGSGAALVI